MLRRICSLFLLIALFICSISISTNVTLAESNNNSSFDWSDWDQGFFGTAEYLLAVDYPSNSLLDSPVCTTLSESEFNEYYPNVNPETTHAIAYFNIDDSCIILFGKNNTTSDWITMQWDESQGLDPVIAEANLYKVWTYYGVFTGWCSGDYLLYWTLRDSTTIVRNSEDYAQTEPAWQYQKYYLTEKTEEENNSSTPEPTAEPTSTPVTSSTNSEWDDGFSLAVSMLELTTNQYGYPLSQPLDYNLTSASLSENFPNIDQDSTAAFAYFDVDNAFIFLIGKNKSSSDSWLTLLWETEYDASIDSITVEANLYKVWSNFKGLCSWCSGDFILSWNINGAYNQIVNYSDSDTTVPDWQYSEYYMPSDVENDKVTTDEESLATPEPSVEPSSDVPTPAPVSTSKPTVAEGSVKWYYDIANDLTVADLNIKSGYDSLYGGYHESYYYQDLELLPEDVEWITSPRNKNQTVEAGAIYRKLAKLMTGSVYALNHTNDYATRIIDNIPEDWEDYIETITPIERFFAGDYDLPYIAEVFKSLNSAYVSYDGSNLSCLIVIPDLDKTIAEIGCNNEMMGYFLASLSEYRSPEFSGNGCIFRSADFTWACQDELDGEEIKLLQKGSKGNLVKDLQAKLLLLGFYEGSLDGDYGNGTATAVSAFQEANNMTVDGIASVETQTVLNQVISSDAD